VIAGHRRLEAAKLAGIKKVPVHVRENGNARAAALSENLHREDLDPIDTARGLVELAAELNLTTNKKIAEALDVSDSWVSQHLRLLRLPEGVQTYIAEGHIPVEAERDLRGIAKVSPRIAECIVSWRSAARSRAASSSPASAICSSPSPRRASRTSRR
jgi:ParB family transcriptional regulator, chromosome partitioning protein